MSMMMDRVVMMERKEDREVIRRGEIYLADLGGGVVGSEFSGVRPVLVISNNVGNKFSDVVTVTMISSQITKKQLPTHVYLDAVKHKLDKNSFVGLEQIKTISKWRLDKKLTQLDEVTMKLVDKAIDISLGKI